jgi:Fe(3+) dicitrate transport protein
VTPTERLSDALHALGVEPFLDPAERSFLPWLLTALLVAAALEARRVPRARLRTLARFLFPPSVWLHRSSLLDLQILLVKRLLLLAGLVPVFLTARELTFAVFRSLDAVFGAPRTPAGLPSWLPGALYTAVLFVVADWSRYALHRAMHRLPWLWDYHQVHHSAEVLTPLTFYRTHPVESGLFALRGVLVAGLLGGLFVWLFRGQATPAQVLGVDAVGFLLNGISGNLRHSQVRWSWGPRTERWFISPAQHQLHHSSERRLQEANYGVWLAIWDRAAGSLVTVADKRAGSGADPWRRFGLPAGEANHRPDELLSALLGPLRGTAQRLVPRRAAAASAAMLLLLVAARAVRAGAGVDDGSAADDDGSAADDDDSAADDDDSAAGDRGAPGPESPSPAPAGPGAAPPASASVQERLDVTGVRGAVPRVAGSAQVVGEAELERFERDDVHRVLAAVPGVYVRGEDGYGLRPNIGLRGASSDRSSKVVLMEDGIPLAPAPYAAPAAYYFPMMTRLVQVDVWKGPASIRHGPQTVGGAVDLRTRGIPAGPDAALDLAFGSEHAWKLHGWGGFSGRRAGFVLEGVHLQSDGFKRLDGGGDAGFDKNEVMGKGRLLLPAPARGAQTLEFKLGWSDERSDETYLGLSDADFDATPYRRYAGSANSRMRWQRTQTELRWSLRLGPEIELRAAGWHHWLTRSWTKLNRFRGGPELYDILQHPDAGQAAVYFAVLRGDEDSESPEQALMLGTNEREFHSGGGQFMLHWRRERGRLAHELELGVRVMHDRVRRQHWEDAWLMRSGTLVREGSESETTAEELETATALALHAQETLRLGPVWLIPGLRMELIRTTHEDRLLCGAGGCEPGPAAQQAPALLPGFGALVQPRDWLSVFAGVHRGFSPVSPGQPAEVKPESSWNIEAGARAVHRGLHLEAIGFFNDYQNLLGQCSFASGCSERISTRQYNGGSLRVYGVEALWRQRIVLPRGLELSAQASYAWTGSRFGTTFASESPLLGSVSTGDRLPYVPEHRGSASLGFDFVKGAVELAASGQSAMRDLPGQGPIPAELKIPAQLVLDLAGEARPLPWLRVYTSIGNLTNTAYMSSRRPFGARPGRPLHVMVGLKLRGGQD